MTPIDQQKDIPNIDNNDNKARNLLFGILSNAATFLTIVNILFLTVYAIQVHVKADLYGIPIEYFERDSLELKIYDAIMGMIQVLSYGNNFKYLANFCLISVIIISLLHYFAIKAKYNLSQLNTTQSPNTTMLRVHLQFHRIKLLILKYINTKPNSNQDIYNHNNQTRKCNIYFKLEQLISKILHFFLYYLGRIVAVVFDLCKLPFLSVAILIYIGFGLLMIIALYSRYYNEFRLNYIHNHSMYCSVLNQKEGGNISEILSSDKNSATVYTWAYGGVKFQTPESSGYLLKLSESQISAKVAAECPKSKQ